MFFATFETNPLPKRLETELAAVKEQLRQAAGAAIQAERARQAATDEAESLRSEAARAGAQLSAANAEIERIKTANAELEKQIVSFHIDSRSAIEMARQNLLMMENKIEELDAALRTAEPKEAAPAATPEAASAPADDQPSREIRASSAPAPPSAPEPGGETGAGERR